MNSRYMAAPDRAGLAKPSASGAPQESIAGFAGYTGDLYVSSPGSRSWRAGPDGPWAKPPQELRVPTSGEVHGSEHRGFPDTAWRRKS